MVGYFSSNPNVTCVTCGAEYFGDRIGLFLPWALNRKLHLIELCALGLSQQGSTSSYHRSVFENFPPMSNDTMAEDYALTFRASLIGIRLVVQDVLVKYRSHDQCLANYNTEFSESNKGHKLSLTSMRQAERDLTYYLDKNKIISKLALSVLRLHIFAQEHIVMDSLHAQRSHFLNYLIFRLLSLAKIYRLFHPINWIKQKKIVKQIYKSQREYLTNKNISRN
jgi:hypothetical protein